ncbi:MAG: hypothetical protein ACXVB9_18715 [Bdellovibrionota bacterium]
MKSLLLAFLFALPAHAANISVTIDGQTYSCSGSASSGGCDCKITQNGVFYYTVTYNGQDIKNGSYSYSNGLDALTGCKQDIQNLPACR